MKIVADSSVLIPYLDSRQYADIVDPARRTGRLLLCSIVAAEILAGARDRQEDRSYRHFFGQFQRLGLVVTPDDAAWHRCGALLSRYRRRYGAIETRAHQNDVLIVLTTCHYSLTEETVLLTENDVHFRTWLRLVGAYPGVRLQAMRRV